MNNSNMKYKIRHKIRYIRYRIRIWLLYNTFIVFIIYKVRLYKHRKHDLAMLNKHGVPFEFTLPQNIEDSIKGQRSSDYINNH